MGRAETLTLSQACIKIKITDLPWLPGYQHSQNIRSSDTNTINLKGGKGLIERRQGREGGKEILKDRKEGRNEGSKKRRKERKEVQIDNNDLSIKLSHIYRIKN